MAVDFKSMERAIAKVLGDWWGVPFRRTPSSGAWNTQSFNMGHGNTDFHGDIVAPPEAQFPFSVECKAYKSVEIYKAMYAKSNIYEWWTQCRKDARRAKKTPMLVMKENAKRPLVAISLPVYNLLFADCFTAPDTVIRLKWKEGTHVRSICIMDLGAFTASLPVIQSVKGILNA